MRETQYTARRYGRDLSITLIVMLTLLIFGYITDYVDRSEAKTANANIMEVRVKVLSEKLDKLDPKGTLEKASRGVDLQDIPILSKSAIRPERLDKYLEKSNLKGLGNSFLAAQNEYGVNVIVLTAIAIHESNWGSNTITVKKNNIFSINANDRNPTGDAWTFKTKTNCILEGARLLKENYLTKGGKFYNGATLEGINVLYASDTRTDKPTNDNLSWADKIRSRIKSIQKEVM